MKVSSRVRHLPMLASVIGKQMGVRVVFDNNTDTAATDGKTIFVPAMTAAGSEEDAQLLEGLIDHEAAHLRYTDFNANQEIKTPLVSALSNIFEDVRIERLLGEQYRGVPANIRKSLAIMIAKGAFPIDPPQDDTPLPNVLTSALILGLRASQLGQDQLADSGKAHRAALEKQLGQALTLKIWEEALQACFAGSTLDTIRAAERVEALIQQAAEEPDPPEEDEKDEDQSPQEDQEPSDPSSPSPNDDDQEQDDQGQDRQDTAGASSPSAGGSDASDEPSAQEVADAARALLDQMLDQSTAKQVAAASEISNAYRDALPTNGMRTFRGDATDVASTGRSFSRGTGEMDISSTWETRELEQLASSMVFGLDRRLETLLEAKADRFRELRRSGLLAGNRLAKVAVGSTNIFYRDEDAEALNTAVLVVNDLSGSMGCRDVSHGSEHITREQAAAAATYALTRSMARLDIPYGVIQFNDGKKLISQLDGRNGPVKGLLKGADGGTNTPSALRGAVDLIAGRHEERKLIILIVDGDDDVVEMEAVLAETIRRGIQVAGVFIGAAGSRMKALFGEDMVQVIDSKDIAKALFQALENVTV